METAKPSDAGTEPALDDSVRPAATDSSADEAQAQPQAQSQPEPQRQPQPQSQPQSQRLARPQPRRRRWRRKPVRRAMVVSHRWLSLVLGLVLLLITTTGALLLFQPEYFRATHGAFYHHTTSVSAATAPIDAGQAVEIVRQAHPNFGPTWVNSDHGIYTVGDPAYNLMYGVDPGTGRITGLAHRNGGTLGALANIHECALSCKGYPLFVPFLAETVPTGGITWLNGLTWGTVVLGVFGLVLLFLAVTGMVTWWPGIRRLRHGFRVRTGRGRFTRDYDLHRTVGALAVPFLLMWGLTGAAMEFPVVENSWLAITGGHSADPHKYEFTAKATPEGAPELTLAQASAAATAQVPGRVVTATMPTADSPYYALSISRPSFDASGYSMFRGDAYVYVNAHDAGDTKTASGLPDSVSNSFYDRIVEPSHFGWLVNGWWRIIWALFGLSPLLLAVTGVSTWLVRRKTRKTRAKVQAQKQAQEKTPSGAKAAPGSGAAVSARPAVGRPAVADPAVGGPAMGGPAVATP